MCNGCLRVNRFETRVGSMLPWKTALENSCVIIVKPSRRELSGLAGDTLIPNFIFTGAGGKMAYAFGV